MVFDDLKEIFSTPEKNAQKYKNKLKEHENVPRMGELKKLLDYAEKNNTLIEYNILSEEFKDNTENLYIEDEILNNIYFYTESKEILGMSKRLIHINGISFADFMYLKGVLYLLYINYYKFKKNELNNEEIIKRTVKSELIKYLMINTTNFRINSIDINIDEFLIRLKHLNFENDDVKEFNNIIISYISYGIGEDTSLRFFNHISFGAIHLMACSAAKNKRNVTYEDVVIGYLLIFKILTEDLTSYINQLYHGD